MRSLYHRDLVKVWRHPPHPESPPTPDHSDYIVQHVTDRCTSEPLRFLTNLPQPTHTHSHKNIFTMPQLLKQLKTKSKNGFGKIGNYAEHFYLTQEKPWTKTAHVQRNSLTPACEMWGWEECVICCGKQRPARRTHSPEKCFTFSALQDILKPTIAFIDLYLFTQCFQAEGRCGTMLQPVSEFWKIKS